MNSEEYVKLQDMWLKATEVKKGSWVKVLRKAESRESGWEGLWYPPGMDACIGKMYQVVGVHATCGLQLAVGEDMKDIWSFPFFILKPAEAPKSEKYRFKSFEQVLVRDGNESDWSINLFSNKLGASMSYPFNCMDTVWGQCIPYAGHEHLLGTTNEPEDWKKYYDKG